MNKIGMAFGLAAIATLAGCKDPDYKYAGAKTSQNEVKDIAVVEAKSCTCAPGTAHAEPCKCGAPDCKCAVAPKPVITADLSKPATPAPEVKPAPAPVPEVKPVEPEYTTYIVQNGDYLAKISKKYNVTISSIKRLNPSIKKDVIWVGQKIKLPGKIDVGEQKEPAKAAPVAKAVAQKGYAPYTGATKDYVVKNGDTLGAIAYGNGINIRQLKELNGLSSDSLKIGQKLKIPAEKPVAAAKPVEKKAVAPAAPAPVAEKKPAEAAPAPAVEEKPVAPAPVAEETKDEVSKAIEQLDEKPAEKPVAAEKPADKPAVTYIVQEGDDMTGVSIRWGVSAADIRELNNMAEGDQLVPGQVIKLPADAQQ